MSLTLQTGTQHDDLDDGGGSDSSQRYERPLVTTKPLIRLSLVLPNVLRLHSICTLAESTVDETPRSLTLEPRTDLATLTILTPQFDSTQLALPLIHRAQQRRRLCVSFQGGLANPGGELLCVIRIVVYPYGAQLLGSSVDQEPGNQPTSSIADTPAQC